MLHDRAAYWAERSKAPFERRFMTSKVMVCPKCRSRRITLYHGKVVCQEKDCEVRASARIRVVVKP